MISCGIPLGFEGSLGYVAADDLGGGRRMTRHLLEIGRTRIATITGPLDTPGGRLRLEGYRDELGSLYDETLVAHADYSRDGGAVAMRMLLEAGRRVPQDVAVGGFDDSGLAATLDPPLTTVRQPLDQIAGEMVRLLIELVEGGEPAPVTLPTSLVVRASTGAVPAPRP